jgi:hypothetical protein
LKTICAETLMQNMESVTCAVERLIAKEMPERFGIILDDSAILRDFGKGLRQCLGRQLLR